MAQLLCSLPSPPPNIFMQPHCQILQLRDAVVAPSGAVFNRWLFLRGTRWYYSLPPALLFTGPRVKRVVSLVMIWSDFFQHFVFDSLTKVRPGPWHTWAANWVPLCL